MKKGNLLILIISILFTNISCSSETSSNTNSDTTNTQRLYFNGKIFTVDENNPWSEAILIEGNKIVFVGSTNEANSKAKDNVKRIDLKGKLVLPGFHDVHMHPMEVGATTTVLELDEFETNAERYISTIRSTANRYRNLPWIIGFGHSINTLLASARSPLDIIDDAVSDRPVIIMEQTSHSMWINSKGLELAGITSQTPNPEGGIIVKKNGKLTGILVDNAGDVVFQQALKIINDSNGEYFGMTDFVLPELAKHGITSVCDARTYWKRDQHKTWQRLANDGRLTARFNLGLWAYPTEEDSSQIEMLKSLFSNNDDSFLKINQIKLYSDGITHNTTAALHSNYKVDYFNQPTNNGLNYFTESRIAKYISKLEKVGFDFHIHTIGNRGVSEALNAIEQSATSLGRHRLTHVEMVDTKDLSRFSQLNVTADAQVAGDFTKPEHWEENEVLVGAALANNLIPIKSLREANTRITLSSDWNVSSLNPFIGIQNAVTRNPQNISLQEAIKAYTINGAYVMRQESKLGSLETGKIADFVVIDKDIFTIPVTQINQAKVVLTVFNGDEIYKK
jgi:predicted amidohydrolase YtcJ